MSNSIATPRRTSCVRFDNEPASSSTSTNLSDFDNPNPFTSIHEQHPEHPNHRRSSDIGPQDVGDYSGQYPVSQVPFAPHHRRVSGAMDLPLFDEHQSPVASHARYVPCQPAQVYPHDIALPPTAAYGVRPTQPLNIPSHRNRDPTRPLRSALRRTVSQVQHELHEKDDNKEVNYADVEAGRYEFEARPTRRGVLANMVDYASTDQYSHGEDDAESEYDASRPCSRSNSEYGVRLERLDSMASVNSLPLDSDDPQMTGVVGKHIDDQKDIEAHCHRKLEYEAHKPQLSYKQRRKEKSKIRIEMNVTSVLNRQLFVLKLAAALMSFGAPAHRIEGQLMAAAKILEIDMQVVQLPNVLIFTFGDVDTKTSETHFVKCSGGLDLGKLHKVHGIYRAVLHDQTSATKATTDLDDLMKAKPIYPNWMRCLFAFLLSAIICPMAFGGSFADMWIAGSGACILAVLKFYFASKSDTYANVYEVTATMFISFLARGLSSIRTEIFCYNSITVAGIIGILPGYMILSSSLELGSKNIIGGSVKMVYALIYTLFLGVGLEVGSSLYLLFDPIARHNLQALVGGGGVTMSLAGSFIGNMAPNGTNSTGYIPVAGTWTFSNGAPANQTDIVMGCYRPPDFPWYLQPFPGWTQWFLVPIFATFSSLANLQPYRSRQLPVMVIIASIGYGVNKLANEYIFTSSDIVSALGAFVIGVLGNWYSRAFGGTAFTSMVTGVLFLVPSGLAAAGGIASSTGLDIGEKMIDVTIGITVGLFMSQTVVYLFGSRKNAAVFSF